MIAAPILSTKALGSDDVDFWGHFFFFFSSGHGNCLRVLDNVVALG
jgi:hypothetical protein